MAAIARDKGGQAAVIAHKQAADEAYEHLLPLVSEMQSGGKLLHAIAHELNAMGHMTRRGKSRNRMQCRECSSELRNRLEMLVALTSDSYIDFLRVFRAIATLET